MVSFLDFTLQILILPYCYHGNKWAVKTVNGTKSHCCIIGFGHSFTETNRLSQQGSAAAQPCHCESLRVGTGPACASVQLMANCLWQGLWLFLRSVAVQPFSISCITWAKQMYLTSGGALREGGYLLTAQRPLPTTPFTEQFWENKQRVNKIWQ